MEPNAFNGNGHDPSAAAAQSDYRRLMAGAADSQSSAESSVSAAARHGRDTAPTRLTHSPRLALTADTISPLSPPPPVLTSELVELTIGISLRLLPGKFYLPGADPSVSHPLNVLSRSIMPTPSKVALMLLPTVTLDSAAECVGDQTQLLNMMAQLAAAPYRRPLAYDSYLFLSNAARKGSLGVLQWWFNNKDSVPLLCNADDVIYGALFSGNVHLVDWCVEHGLALPKVNVVFWMSENVAVLDTCLALGLKQEYTECVMDAASEKGKVHVLEWWKSSGLPLKYSHRALELAITYKHHCVLDWWIDSGLKLYGDELELTRCAIRASDLFALEWLARSSMLLVHSTLLADLFAANDIRVIEWCMDRFKMQPSLLGLKVDVWLAASKQESTLALDLAEKCGFQVPSVADTSPCLEAAARLGSIAVLDWWRRKIQALYANDFESALNAAIATGHVPVLDWFKQHGYFKRDTEPDMLSLTLAAKGGHLPVLKWFAKQPQSAYFSAATFLGAVESGHIDIVRWWRSECMPIPSFVAQGTAGRRAFMAAAERGQGAMLKEWVDARIDVAEDDVFKGVTLGFARDVMFELLPSSKPDSFAYFKWWMTMFGCRTSETCMEIVAEASALNRVDILQWVLESHLLDRITVYPSVCRASFLGHIEALDWWAVNAGVIKTSLEHAECFGEEAPDVFKACWWWAHNNSKSLSLDECELPPTMIGLQGSVALMDRMLRLGVFTVPKKYSVYDVASETGSVDILAWWYATDLADKKDKHYSPNALLSATKLSQVSVLDWWRRMCVPGPWTSACGTLKLKLPFRSLDDMIDHGELDAAAIEWWIKSGLLPDTAPESDQDSSDDESDADVNEAASDGSESDSESGSGSEADDQEDPMDIDG